MGVTNGFPRRMRFKRMDTPPGLARLNENIQPAFAPAEVLDNFERYAKMFHEIFGGR